MLESAAAALGNLAYYNDMNRIRIAETGGLNALIQVCVCVICVCVSVCVCVR